MKLLVFQELVIIFLGTFVSLSLRFEWNYIELIKEFESEFQLLAYPFIWCFFLYSQNAWEKSKLLTSNAYLSCVLSAGWQTLLFFSAFSYLIKFPISRIWVLASTTVITLTLLATRMIVKLFLNAKLDDPSRMNYLYIGDEKNKSRHIEDFVNTFGFTPLVMDFSLKDSSSVEDFLKIYQEKIAEFKIFGVMVESRALPNMEYLKIIADTRNHLVHDVILLSAASPLLGRLEILENPRLVRIQENTLISSGAIVKRIFDVFFSAIAITLLSPIFLITALLVKFSSKGTVLYLDERIGQNGENFTFPKFRTMYKNADERRLEVLGRPDQDMANRYKNDPRITPIGRFLRRWSIDELPQLWSVLKGDMSIVGPRPVLKQEDIQIKDQHRIRFLAKPGLTGLWQVSGRKEVAWEDRMLRDIAYIDNWSLSYDVSLILRTFGAIIKGQGAY